MISRAELSDERPLEVVAKEEEKEEVDLEVGVVFVADLEEREGVDDEGEGVVVVVDCLAGEGEGVEDVVWAEGVRFDAIVSVVQGGVGCEGVVAVEWKLWMGYEYWKRCA